MQHALVPKEQVFKLRIDAEDRKSLDALAAHYSAPAATVVRMLVKDRHREIVAKATPAAFDPLEVADIDALRSYVDVLEVIADSDEQGADGISTGDIGVALSYRGWQAHMKGLGRMLNNLRRAGYIRRLTTGYRLDEKGKAWAAKS